MQALTDEFLERLKTITDLRPSAGNLSHLVYNLRDDIKASNLDTREKTKLVAFVATLFMSSDSSKRQQAAIVLSMLEMPEALSFIEEEIKRERDNSNLSKLDQVKRKLSRL